MESQNESPVTDTVSSKTTCGERASCCCKRCRWIGLVIVGAIVSAFAFHAYSWHYGTGWGCASWHGQHENHRKFGAEAPRHAEWVADRLMSEVNGSEAQKAKAREITAAAVSDLQSLVMKHEDTHKALLTILKAPALDRGKIESLRVGALHDLDDASRRLTLALGDLADVLTPAQRLQLAEQIEKHHGF